MCCGYKIIRYYKKIKIEHNIRINMLEKILKIESIYNGKILNLQKRIVKLQSGKIVQREIINHPGSVAIIPIIDDKTIILIEQYRSTLEKIILEIPAGTIEFNEKPEDCARRELLEETGYKAKKLKKLFSGYTTPGYSNEIMHIFLATDLTYIKESPEEDENIRTRIIKLDKINQMIKNGEIMDIKTICSIKSINSEL